VLVAPLLTAANDFLSKFTGRARLPWCRTRTALKNNRRWPQIIEDFISIQTCTVAATVPGVKPHSRPSLQVLVKTTLYAYREEKESHDLTSGGRAVQESRNPPDQLQEFIVKRTVFSMSRRVCLTPMHFQWGFQVPDGHAEYVCGCKQRKLYAEQQIFS
jgi:hypothetical protein